MFCCGGHRSHHGRLSSNQPNGTPLMVLKGLGGWETLEMVRRCAHLAPSHLASHASAVTFWSPPAGNSEMPERASQLNN
ncbi:MAG: integrase [Candidimonas sp.]|nr:MAG: integrase [Candidimonas sp.]